MKQNYTTLAFASPTYVSQRTTELMKLYSMFSNTDETQQLLYEYRLHYTTAPFVYLLSVGAGMNFVVDYVGGTLAPQAYNKTNNVVVCFSGGKDSTATALRMRELGWNVYLFYVKGINKSYPDEQDKAVRIAKMLGMPLHTVVVRSKGKSIFADNPIKNQLIASMALDYAIDNKIGVDIAFGDFTTDRLVDADFSECWSDCVEMWDAFKDFVKDNFVVNFDLHIPFNSYVDTLDVMSRNMGLFRLTQSCVLPYRFRGASKKRNEAKYGISLLPNRCGSCWKCCVEYIHNADCGVQKYDPVFYAHCLDILRKKMPILHKHCDDLTDAGVYKAFLYRDFYEHSKHKAWGQTI